MDEAVDSSWNKVDRPQSSCDGFASWKIGGSTTEFVRWVASWKIWSYVHHLSKIEIKTSKSKLRNTLGKYYKNITTW